jgi:hypothetical protein
MAALSERKLDIVRTLVDSAPDAVVDGLRQALAAAGGDAALAAVREMVDLEANDRQLRNAVLGPLVPMCVGDGTDPLRLTFPVQVAGQLWRGLKAQAPAFVRNAEVALYSDQPAEDAKDQFDRLLRLAAKGVRAGEVREFKQARQACDAARPDGAEALLACLEVAPVVRGIAHRLGGWVTHQNAQSAVAARLAYKDAVALAPDGGPCFFQMMAAQLPNPYTVLRIISSIMEKPTERYLADSELGVFGEVVLREVEEALAAAAALDADAGPEAAIAAARHVNRVTNAAGELETYVTLSRDQGWGKRLLQLRNSLSAMVEARCDEAEKLFEHALPGKRSRRGAGRLGQPDEQAVRRCRTLLTFISELRTSAATGGFAAARSRLLEDLGLELDQCVEDLLETVKAAEAPNAAAAQAFLAVAADLSALVRDEKAAGLVKRRAAAAAAPPPVDPVQALLKGA